MKRNYKRDYEFQKRINAKQAKKIESLELQVEKLKLQCEEKDKTIGSIDFLRSELIEDVEEYKKLKNEYKELIQELRYMKSVMNQDFFKGRWKLIKFLIK